MSLSYSGSLPRSSVTSYQGRKVCWNISSQGTSGSAPDLAGDFQRQSGSPAHNGQPDVWVNPMTDPTNAVSSDQAPSTSMLLNSPLQRWTTPHHHLWSWNTWWLPKQDFYKSLSNAACMSRTKMQMKDCFHILSFLLRTKPQHRLHYKTRKFVHPPHLEQSTRT